MIRPSRALAATLLAAALVTASACSGDGGGKASTGESGEGKADKVTYVTAFGAVGRDSFVWVAKEKGFFSDGSVSELLFPAYAKLAGLDPKSVTMQGAQTTAPNGLMAQRKVDALSTFLLSKKALETISKKEVVVMPYGDHLKDLFGNAIIAREEVIAGSIAVLQANGLIPAGLAPDQVADFSFIPAN